MIDPFHSYNDLCTEISILETQIELAEQEVKQWWIGGRLFNTVTMDNAADRVDRLNDQLDQMREQLEYRQQAKEKLDSLLGCLEGLEYKVAYKKIVERKTLQEIARELGYSYNHIRRVNMDLKKRTG